MPPFLVTASVRMLLLSLSSEIQLILDLYEILNRLFLMKNVCIFCAILVPIEASQQQKEIVSFFTLFSEGLLH